MKWIAAATVVGALVIAIALVNRPKAEEQPYDPASLPWPTIETTPYSEGDCIRAGGEWIPTPGYEDAPTYGFHPGTCLGWQGP